MPQNLQIRRVIEDPHGRAPPLHECCVFMWNVQKYFFDTKMFDKALEKS